MGNEEAVPGEAASQGDASCRDVGEHEDGRQCAQASRAGAHAATVGNCARAHGSSRKTGSHEGSVERCDVVTPSRPEPRSSSDLRGERRGLRGPRCLFLSSAIEKEPSGSIVSNPVPGDVGQEVLVRLLVPKVAEGLNARPLEFGRRAPVE
mmetsp:Transcript_91542/g.258516  ORF Transcript_91542/g.258516 Transcript_91542/m.258516 type:complete len:151 (+) Transcript_91542:325-777(+)